MKRGDWVVCVGMPHGPAGVVLRVARDGSWVDVRWTTRDDEWGKRMHADAIRLLDGRKHNEVPK